MFQITTKICKQNSFSLFLLYITFITQFDVHVIDYKDLQDDMLKNRTLIV